MADQAYSGPGYIRFDGAPVSQTTNLEISFETGNTDVVTLTGGRVGHNKGPKKIMVKADGVMPADGFEIDWPSVALDQDPVEIDFVIPGVIDIPCTGDIRNCKLATTTEKGNSYDFEFHGSTVEPGLP